MQRSAHSRVGLFPTSCRSRLLMRDVRRICGLRINGGEMTIIKRAFTFIWAFFIVCFGNTSMQCRPAATQPSQASVFATWKGESICVGNRPACKNEIVVYRFEAVDGKPDTVLLLADKIIN